MDAQLPPGAGKDSFELIDQQKLFNLLPIDEAQFIVDLGCGFGTYTLHFAKKNPRARVVGADAWHEGLRHLQKAAKTQNLKNIETLLSDVGKGIPLPDSSADLCFVANVMHDFIDDLKGHTAVQEIKRILKPEGQLAVVEFKKIDSKPGPPVSIRLTPEELKNFLAPFGFKANATHEVGPYHYLVMFTKD